MFKVTTDAWTFFPKKRFPSFFCNFLFHFINNDLKQFKKNHRLVFELWLSKDMHNMSFFLNNMFEVEVRDKQVYDIVAVDYGIL